MNDYEYDYELTEEHYKIAEQNGLPRHLVRQRFYVGWDIERAITKPKGNQGYLRKMQEQARKNGIELSLQGILDRKTKGWTNERIVTTPKYEKANSMKTYIELAAGNGIGKNTFCGRLQRGWDKTRAATEPVRMEHRRRI